MKNSLPEEIILAEMTDDGQDVGSAGEYLAVKLEERQESFLDQRVNLREREERHQLERHIRH